MVAHGRPADVRLHVHRGNDLAGPNIDEMQRDRGRSQGVAHREADTVDIRAAAAGLHRGGVRGDRSGDHVVRADEPPFRRVALDEADVPGLSLAGERIDHLAELMTHRVLLGDDAQVERVAFDDPEPRIAHDVHQEVLARLRHRSRVPQCVSVLVLAGFVLAVPHHEHDVAVDVRGLPLKLIAQ